MNSQHVNNCLVFSTPVELTLKPTGFSRKHDGPSRQQVMCVKLDALLGGRVVTARDFRFDQSRALLGSAIFDDPVRLVLAADKRTGRSRSVLRVSILAAPTTPGQEVELLDIERTVPGGLGVWDLPDEQVGLFLGDRWFPAGAAALEPVPVGPALAADSPIPARSSAGSFLASLSEEVERLLAAQADKQQLARPKRGREVERLSVSHA